MKLGFIGLGKMGLKLARNLLLNQHPVTVDEESVEPGVGLGKR